MGVQASRVLIRSHADFRMLWLAQVVSQLGDKIYALTLAWWILELTVTPENPQGDASQVGYMLAVGALAATLFGPWLGSLSDRFSRRSLMIWADLGRALLCGVLAVMASLGQAQMSVLYLIVFLLSVFNLLFNPATQAILGSLVKEEEMTEALSLQQLTQDLCNLLGAGVGGALVAALGVRLGFTFNALSFVVSALFIAGISRREKPVATEESESRGGLGFLRERPTILGLLLVFCLANLFLVPLFVLIPAVAKIVLQGSAMTLGLLEGALAGGSIVATFVVLKMRTKRLWQSLASAILLNGLALLGMAYSTSPIQLAVLLALTGACLAVVNVQFNAMLQQLTPDALKGRVFSLVETIATACFPISYFLSGLAAEHLTFPEIFLLCGAGVTVAGALVPAIPKIREL